MNLGKQSQEKYNLENLLQENYNSQGAQNPNFPTRASCKKSSCEFPSDFIPTV